MNSIKFKSWYRCWLLLLPLCLMVQTSPQTRPQHQMIFFGISSHNEVTSERGEAAKFLRMYQRNSWLKWLDTCNDCSHRFFVHYANHMIGLESDVVVVPSETTHTCSRMKSTQHACRSGAMVRYILGWALQSTNASYFVATEHDSFVCLPQLQQLLATLGSPNSMLAHWFYPRTFTAATQGCPEAIVGKSEQTFAVYGRLLAAKLVNFASLEGTNGCYDFSLTWAKNIRPMLQYLHVRGEVTFILDHDTVVVHDDVFGSWKQLGPPAHIIDRLSSCPLDDDNKEMNEEGGGTSVSQTQKHKWIESLCECGAISYHMRGYARSKNKFEKTAALLYNNALQWTKASLDEGGGGSRRKQVIQTLLSPECNRDTCPSASSLKSSSNTSKGIIIDDWWNCPSHLLNNLNEPLSGEGLERALACHRHRSAT
jgi:hypothetical protein